jgi:hypothetical protein
MKKVATPKQTGQGGTDFENKVIAYFLSCMLAKMPPLSSVSGTIARIDFQVAGDGWLFDDALLTIVENGVIKRIAVSIKSNKQFNSNGCPTDLNRLLWEQYLCHSSRIFNSISDSLCLAESIISAKVAEDLNSLLSLIKAQDAKDFHERIYKYGSQAKRKLYESFECPDDLTNLYSVNVEATANLLKHFLHVEMDFHRVNSLYESKSIDLCRRLLNSQDANDAKKLYQMLCHLCLQMAQVNGYLDIPTLLGYLRADFSLAGIPDYQTDWKKLQNHSTQKLSLIQTRLGNKVSINRGFCIEEIKEKLRTKQICVIQGISGAGKTVLAKEFAESRIDGSKIIWLDAADFDSSIESDLQLQHTLIEVVQLVPSNEAYFFIDGAERLYQERQQQKLALLINTIISKNLPWKIIIPCPTESVDKLFQVFSQHNVNTECINSFNMPILSHEMILHLVAQYPELASLLMDEGFRNILNNLKLLDKLLLNVKRIASLSQIGSPGESHLIDFIWQEEIENTDNGIQKSSFMQIVAEKQADQLLTGVSTADFNPANISMADYLKKGGFIKIDQQKIYFSHDLYSDWARYKLLLAHSERLSSFLTAKSLLSPLWTKAIRLYGLSLLEKNLKGENWEKTYALFNDNSSQHIIIQNLLLESFYLSPNAYQIMSRQKDLLFVADGKLFKKLMKLFLISGTTANPEVLKISKQIGSFTEIEASAYDRLPILSYWPDILAFLHDNINQVITLDLLSVVNVASIWLEKTPLNFICRKEASDITLKAAQLIFSEQAKGRYLEEKITEPVYKGLLAGYIENEEAVSDLCLKISKRKKTEEQIEAPTVNTTISKSPLIMDMLPYTNRESKQWPDGPFERVDNSFQKLCLDTNALLRLLNSNPTLGKEILLAVLIDEPDNRYLGMNRHDDDYSIYNPIGWYPPFFLRGPFLHFMRMHPNEAIELAVRITDFATDRWLENDKEIHKIEQKIIIEYNGTSQNYFGDFYVFGWHKDVGNAPHSLVSILMAFEQFLYEEIEKGKSIEKYVEYAINKSHSLAIVGVLITVAKFELTLFLKELKKLLPISILFRWDSQFTFASHSFRPNDLPNSWREHAEKWMQRRHRSFPLKDTLINVFLLNSDFEVLFNEIIPYWENELKEAESKNSLDIFLLQMIPQFKRENYKERIPDRRGYFEFVEPKEVSDRLKEGRTISLTNMQESQVSDEMEMIIEQDLPLDVAGVEYLWKKIQKWAMQIEPGDIQNDYVLGSPLTNIFSSLTVLIHSEDVWVKEHPEYLDWIKSFTENIIDQQLKNNEPADRYGTPYDWNVRFASIMPGLWKKNIADKSYLKTVAGIMILFNDATSAAFFSAAGNFFNWDDPDFLKAQNLFLLYYNEKRQTFINTFPQIEQIRAIQEKYILAFTENNISSEFLEWPEKMDFHKATIMLNCLPDFKAIKQTDQKSYFLYLLQQGLARMESRLTATLDKMKENDLPDDFDRAVLIRIAECLPHLTQEEKPESIWMHVLKYGYLASNWINVFFDGFFRFHLQDSSNYPKVVDLLNKMLLFTHKWFTWEAKKSFKRSGDFRNSALGLDPRTVNIWKNNYSVFIKEAAPLYREWFKRNKYNPHTIESLMSLIVTDSGILLLPEGLQHVKAFFSKVLEKKSEKPTTGMVYVGHKELDDKLASTLSFLWENKKDLIKCNNEMFSAYRELLQYLVAIENVIGIELQQRLLH